jgi:hypothetical protein
MMDESVNPGGLQQIYKIKKECTKTLPFIPVFTFFFLSPELNPDVFEVWEVFLLQNL